ncbi:PucR family transcriptional regulator [Nocardia goodfellowii]|uniref:PucR C-terminal helix-turn-helix domain-containing protein n=1 Tax=Nocardia goodfellowii TaxID=882446 RepID=A0ABS4QHK1_9NOCA|nr:helix-turn-helix domain-containing protein [Nocardia goodfellowii]MBP2191125.1 hypothetical protein [Nocardia goodfellowii]
MNTTVRHSTASARARSVHISRGSAPAATPPSAAALERGEVPPADLSAQVIHACTELAVAGYRGEDLAGRIAELESSARLWAKLGLGLDRLQQAVYAGFRAGSERVDGRQLSADEWRMATRRQLDTLESVHVRLSRVYTCQLPAPANSHHAATRNLAVALLRGDHAGPLARHCGIPISARYHVIALGVPAVADRSKSENGPATATRIDAALTEYCGPQALSIVGADGGTLLIPHDFVEDSGLGELFDALAEATRQPLIAVALTAATSDIPAADRQAHDFLDTATAMHVEPGLYRMSDLGLHFQLTRPGPARDVLRALLIPLDDHPELLHTLTTHLANDMNRQRTAKKLHVHTNTIDYRLKRIHQLTGCDPCSVAGLWRLRSALIVRRYTDRSPAAAHAG